MAYKGDATANRYVGNCRVNNKCTKNEHEFAFGISDSIHIFALQKLPKGGIIICLSSIQKTAKTLTKR